MRLFHRAAKTPCTCGFWDVIYDRNCNHLLRKYKCIIDIFMDYSNILIILIEEKYRKEASIPDDFAIRCFCGEASATIVVTKCFNDFGIHNAPEGRQLIRIRAFVFLYLHGNAERFGFKGKE